MSDEPKLRDWEWVDDDGRRFVTHLSSMWSMTIWRRLRPVPFKRNKRRYGR